MDPFQLTGRRALVTGGSRGIGLAIARALGQRGAELVITGRKLESLNAATTTLRAESMRVEPLVCHQGDVADIRKLFTQLDERDWTADVAIMNAATNPFMGPLLDIDSAAWEKILAVNLTGALVTMQEAARRMQPFRRGSLIAVASIAGIDPLPGLGAYSVSKAGLIGMVKALAKELGTSGIRVNAIAPGLVETRFSSALLQDRASYEKIWPTSP